MLRPAAVCLVNALCLALFASCASRAPRLAQDAAVRLQERTGVPARVGGIAAPEVPAGVRLDDGLTPDEAVAVALWNNAAFQVSVSDLGFARADLLEAGVLTNPVLSLLFPVGPKQLESTLRWPAEILWERPRRVAAARLAADAAAQRLVQAGLDLVFAVRTAYADLSLAIDRERLARDAVALVARIDTLTQSRLVAGDIGELEARGARVDAARAQQDAEGAGYDVTVARDRVRLLLGLTSEAQTLDLAPSATETVVCAPTPDLMREALAARPDVRAAELNVEAAAARLGWERSRILALTALLDANGEGRDGFESGPGLEMSLPIFNRNQAGRARASAELQRAAAVYAAIQQQVAFELREASTQFARARQSAAAWRERIVMPLELTVADAERSFSDGEVSYLFVLEGSRRLTEARVRARELAADEQRARARIERAVGRSCGAPSQETPRDH